MPRSHSQRYVSKVLEKLQIRMLRVISVKTVVTTMTFKATLCLLYSSFKGFLLQGISPSKQFPFWVELSKTYHPLSTGSGSNRSQLLLIPCPAPPVHLYPHTISPKIFCVVPPRVPPNASNAPHLLRWVSGNIVRSSSKLELLNGLLLLLRIYIWQN